MRDSGIVPLSDQTLVTVRVADENDNAPFFPTLPTPVISELVQPGTEVFNQEVVMQ